MPPATNRLETEKSPYLLQHARNPVDWYPWSEEAFARAREEDKPIFLSIGYSTCHWCHVMAHESFESEAVAELLNTWFVSIKVDREERPDIDQMYMAAAQAMTGRGGWPLSIFLLPDGSPFYAGTYFPPRSMGQLPGFGELLTALNTAWREQQDKLQLGAAQLIEAIAPSPAENPSPLPDDSGKACLEALAAEYDRRWGGFGGAPKFPRPAVFRFLCDYHGATGDRTARSMVLETLEMIGNGGICDHVGGGFHRYSVDDRWFVPHFEKMLYDQGQLATACLDAWLISGTAQFSRMADAVFTYLLRDLRDDSGGFYSAEDADSENPYHPEEHGEGAFYLWTRRELNELLGENAELLITCYGVKEDGNVSEDPHREFTGRNLLHRTVGNRQAAGLFGLDEAEVKRRLAEARRILLEARSTRKRPHLDDKIITSWNGLLLGPLARGAAILERPELLDCALDCARFLNSELWDRENQTLLRRYRDREAGLAGQLDDYTNLIDGLLDLYQATHQPEWLHWAETLTRSQIRLFWSEPQGCFYDSVADPRVKLRMHGFYDGAEPAGNSTAALNLVRLGYLRGNKEWLTLADRLFATFSTVCTSYPSAMPLLLTAWRRRREPPAMIVVAGDRHGEDTAALLRAAVRRALPDQLLLLADGGENQHYLAEGLPHLESFKPGKDGALAAICSNHTCQAPIGDPAALERALDELRPN